MRSHHPDLVGLIGMLLLAAVSYLAGHSDGLKERSHLCQPVVELTP